MRTINKRQQPNALVQWRQDRIAKADEERWPFNYDALRQSEDVIGAVEAALYAEQGGICAYTGIPLRFKSDGRAAFHIEHVKAQAHCDRGEDTDYSNLLACWPEPNHGTGVSFGAPRKGNWPKPHEAVNFVSPLKEGCTQRFTFSNENVASAQATDQAASLTIDKLGLQESELVALRKRAIQGALAPRKTRHLKLKELRKIHAGLEQDERALDAGGDVRLRGYCFAIKPAVGRRIRRLEAIRESRRQG
jgi:uncharacterized protein (TIGR02646 family)